ncbi:MAG TPA: enoyl-CoA hydratase-related protein [Solirubrobacteraceae bacterium]|nr:enoyl-CoA hydratase-related protein [Solirubrobacteraceae bacterium]
MSDLITITGEAPVITATMHSPPANALGLPMADALNEVCDAVESSGARVLVLRSDIEGFFAAGADIKLLGRADGAVFHDYLRRLRGVLERIAALDAASIAAIDGHALGGGLELSLACTLRVGGPGAKLGVPEIKLGVIPGAAGTQRLVHHAGPGAALDLLITGRSVEAEEAHRMGLLQRLDPEGADRAAEELAAQIAAMPKQAIAAAKRSVQAAIDLPLDGGLAVEMHEITGLFHSPDAREGLSAFLEKRKPEFS